MNLEEKIIVWVRLLAHEETTSDFDYHNFNLRQIFIEGGKKDEGNGLRNLDDRQTAGQKVKKIKEWLELT